MTDWEAIEVQAARLIAEREAGLTSYVTYRRAVFDLFSASVPRFGKTGPRQALAFVLMLLVMR